MKNGTKDKYEGLWLYIAEMGEKSFTLTFGDAEKISGVPIDHSLLKYKKNLSTYGYEVKRISLKTQTIEFGKCFG